MRKWSVELFGDRRFIKRLADVKGYPTITVYKDKDRYFLESTKFESESNPRAVRRIAVSIVNQIIAIFKFSNITAPVLNIGAVIDNNTGNQAFKFRFTELLASNESILNKLVSLKSVPEEILESEINQICEILLAADSNPRLKRIIDFLINENLTLSNMYRIVEVVVEDEGGHHKFIKLPHINENRFRLFKQTINSPSLSGAQARHGTTIDKSGIQGMSFDEIKEMTFHIVRNWLAKHGLQLP